MTAPRDFSKPPIPHELEDAIDTLHDTGFTLRKLIDVSLVAIAAAEKYPEMQRAIAKNLHVAYFDYDRLRNDDDLYFMRYRRLIPDIEEQLALLSELYDATKETGKPLDHQWIKLKWLIEDQAKIIS